MLEPASHSRRTTWSALFSVKNYMNQNQELVLCVVALAFSSSRGCATAECGRPVAGGGRDDLQLAGGPGRRGLRRLAADRGLISPGHKTQHIQTSIGLWLEFWKKPRRFIARRAGDRTRPGFDLRIVRAARHRNVSSHEIGNPHNQMLNVGIQWGAVGVVALMQCGWCIRCCFAEMAWWPGSA